MSLTETRIKAALKAPPPAGKRLKLADDHGLYLLIDANANAWWRLRITLDGREKHGSLDTYPTKSLDAARAGTAQARVIAKENGAVAFMNFCAQFRGAARPHRPAIVAATIAPRRQARKLVSIDKHFLENRLLASRNNPSYLISSRTRGGLYVDTKGAVRVRGCSVCVCRRPC
jgi:hypothetical protein